MKKQLSVILIISILILFLTSILNGFQLGINSDNFYRELDNPKFRKIIKKFNIDFIVWHIAPQQEIQFKKELGKIVKFCRKNNIKYLFNIEVVNNMDDIPYFLHEDGTKRWDLKKETLKWLKKDNLFLGVVYDEAMLMQMVSNTDFMGKFIKPYFVNTKDMTVNEAYEAVVKKIKELKNYYKKFGKIMVFEMVFPAFAHAVARAGGVLAPKLLKENFNDLMYYFYAGAATEYHHKQLWANIDLWFYDNFPFHGKYQKKGFHTPEQLFEALKFSYINGFDYVYIEHAIALYTENFELTEYGKVLLKFKKIMKNLKRKSWKNIVPEYVIKMYPYGYWGQKYSFFNPYHPYGSFSYNHKMKQSNIKFLKFLNKVSRGKIPPQANNWNAGFLPYFQKTEYFMNANLPPFLVFDHLAETLPKPKRKTYIFYENK